jgi:hypothetical protein
MVEPLAIIDYDNHSIFDGTLSVLKVVFINMGESNLKYSIDFTFELVGSVSDGVRVELVKSIQRKVEELNP